MFNKMRGMVKKIVNSSIAVLASGFVLFFIEALFPLGDYRWLVLAGIAIVVLVVVNWREIYEFIKHRHDIPAKTIHGNTVDYIGAIGILDRYIHPAIVDKRDSVKLLIRRDILKQFEKVPGAKVNEYEYNRELLHQWIETKAAKLFVEGRGDL